MTQESQSTASVFTRENGAADSMIPPVADRKPVEQVIHGDTRVDNYFWLREKENPEVIRYLEAENAYTDAVLRPTEPLQETLYQEMLSRIQQTDLSVPYILRGYEYFMRTEEGKQYPLYCRRAIAEASPEELLLDLNALAEGRTFLGLGVFEVSDDNQLLAYALDTTGFRQYTLRIKDLRTNALLPFEIERATSAAWAADNRTLFYTVEDEVTKRSHRLYRHTLTSSEADALLFEETDERFHVELERTRSGAYILLVSASHTASEVRYLNAADISSRFRVIAPREENHEYYADHHPTSGEDGTGVFYIRTNSGGRTFRVVTASDADPTRENWREVIPNRSTVMISAVRAFATHLVLYEREEGLPHLRVVDLKTGRANFLANSHRIEFAESAYNAIPGTNPEFVQKHFRFQYESFITPRSVFDYDFETREQTLRKQQPVLGGYDPSQYLIERLLATAPDGINIPISLVSRKNTPRDSTAPLLLYGYGSYGISVPVSFSSNRLSLLDRGISYAIAHIRGGGELGKPWHDAGRLRHKRNTFSDFIACAEYLVAKKYTSPEKLSIEGGSAGGLLMGAVSNMRPDLFHAVITHVPFVDVLNTMLDATLPLTIGEYEEWGNPQFAADYFYMKTYCPYTNIERKAYPAMLVKTSLNDSQVMYWEPAKYVAKLRALKADANMLLFKINMGAGHGGASGRYDYLREIALDYAFLLTQLEIAS
jgi:oligopeptidase B